MIASEPRQVGRGEVTLAGERRHGATGSPVVLLHAGVADRRAWSNVAKRRLRSLLVTVVACAATALAAPSARADIACPQLRDGSGHYTGVARCTVRSGTWTYYQAYVTKNNDCSSIGTYDTQTFRMQILARRGGTGVHIGGVWVVYLDGRARYGSLRFDALDGDGGHHNGHWNYAGGFSKPGYGYTYLADLYTGAAIRYGASPSSFVGLAWGANPPRFEMQFNMSYGTAPYLSGGGTCTSFPLRVQFLR